MGEYVLSDNVYLDLENIWEYVAQNSPQAARRLSKQLLEAFEAIASAPGTFPFSQAQDERIR